MNHEMSRNYFEIEKQIETKIFRLSKKAIQ